MTVTIANNDKTTMTAIYDPAHRENVENFYRGLVSTGTIWSYWINN